MVLIKKGETGIGGGLKERNKGNKDGEGEKEERQWKKGEEELRTLEGSYMLRMKTSRGDTGETGSSHSDTR